MGARYSFARRENNLSRFLTNDADDDAAAQAEARKQQTLMFREEHNAKMEALAARAADIHDQQIGLQLRAEEARLNQAELQNKHLAGAMDAIGKLDPTKPNYEAGLADVIKNYPAAFQKSQNGMENGVNQLISSLNERRAVYTKAHEDSSKHNEEIAAATGIDPESYRDPSTGRINWKDHHAAVSAATKALGEGLPVHSINTTERGVNYSFMNQANPPGDSWTKFAADLKANHGALRPIDFGNEWTSGPDGNRVTTVNFQDKSGAEKSTAVKLPAGLHAQFESRYKALLNPSSAPATPQNYTPASLAPPTLPAIPDEHAAYLRANPQHAASFDKTYGAGASKHILEAQ